MVVSEYYTHVLYNFKDIIRKWKVHSHFTKSFIIDLKSTF